MLELKDDYNDGKISLDILVANLQVVADGYNADKRLFTADQREHFVKQFNALDLPARRELKDNQRLTKDFKTEANKMLDGYITKRNETYFWKDLARSAWSLKTGHFYKSDKDKRQEYVSDLQRRISLIHDLDSLQGVKIEVEKDYKIYVEKARLVEAWEDDYSLAAYLGDILSDLEKLEKKLQVSQPQQKAAPPRPGPR